MRLTRYDCLERRSKKQPASNGVATPKQLSMHKRKTPAIVGMTGAPHTGMSDGSDAGNLTESSCQRVNR
jgi:hypothetical protein